MELIFEKRGRGIRFPNLYYDCDDHIKIKIWNQEKEYYIEIDKEDFDIANQCNWKIREDSKTVYALNSKKGFLHRLINNTPINMETDHIDGNGLNNRKSNLRAVDGKTNALNKRTAEGVYYEDGEYPRYKVHWRENGVQKSKSFSIGAYGADEAKRLAYQFRKEIEKVVYNRPTVSGDGSTPILDMRTPSAE